MWDAVGEEGNRSLLGWCGGKGGRVRTPHGSLLQHLGVPLRRVYEAFRHNVAIGISGVEEECLSGWSKVGVRLGRVFEERFDSFKLGVRRRYGWIAPPEVVTYRGHGTREVLFMKGRVLEAKGLTRSSATDTTRTNLRNMARRFLSAEVPFARLRAAHAGQEVSVVADEEGFFDVRFDLPEPLDGETDWHPVEVELLDHDGAEARATGSVFVPNGATLGVISDLDDTVIQSGVTSLLQMLRTALLNNAHTRLPFEGVTHFYRALQGEANPIFYVSSSPWNLYDLLEDFLHVHGVPAGPLFLKDWSPMALKSHEQHKLGVIRTLLATYPSLPFVLVGDSGERDPEIYRTVVREHPGRIAAVYIRDVTTKERDVVVHAIARQVRSFGVEMLLVSNTAAAAEHAASRGLIPPEALPDIRRASG